jgi:hypothetical protein
MFFKFLIVLFLIYISYAIYLKIILPEHKKIRDEKVVNFMKNLDK